MTLKELVTAVTFDDLLPHLEQFEPQHMDNIYAFREAYDILRNRKPDKEYKGEIHVTWCCNEGMADEDKWISVHPMHDASWEENLSKEIIVADDVHLSLEELAMHCLWEITFYGFSPTEREQTWDRIFHPKRPANPYELALDRLEESIWKHQTPKRLRSRGKQGERYTLWESPRKWFKPMNRSKRKREYRQNKRTEYLTKCIRRQQYIHELTTPDSSLSEKELHFLMNVERGVRFDYHSIGSEQPLSYILESMTRYQRIDKSEYNQAVVVICIPKGFTLHASEINEYKNRVQQHLQYNNMLWGTKRCESEDVQVILLLNQDTSHGRKH